LNTTSERGLLFSTDLLLAVVILLLTSLAGLAFLSSLALHSASALPAYRLQRQGLFFLDALVKNDASQSFPGLAAFDSGLHRVTPNFLSPAPTAPELQGFPLLQSLRLVPFNGPETQWADKPLTGPANQASTTCYSFERLVLVGKEKALLIGVFCDG